MDGAPPALLTFVLRLKPENWLWILLKPSPVKECLTLALDPDPEDAEAVIPAEVLGGEISLLDPEAEGARGGVVLEGVCCVVGVETLEYLYKKLVKKEEKNPE